MPWLLIELLGLEGTSRDDPGPALGYHEEPLACVALWVGKEVSQAGPAGSKLPGQLWGQPKETAALICSTMALLPEANEASTPILP